MRASRLLGIAHEAGGIASAAELIKNGARWEDLYRLRDSGELIELSRGIYRVADAPASAYLDLLAVCRRAPDGMICLNSAASFWDLSDEIPDAVHLAIARGKHRPRIVYPPTRVHVFSVERFSFGRVMEKIDPGDTIAISSRERTVVDLMRLRSRVGSDLALGALRRYLQNSDARPADLLAMARRLRVGSVMAEAMKPLLA